LHRRKRLAQLGGVCVRSVPSRHPLRERA
jgi:hypothetical protein